MNTPIIEEQDGPHLEWPVYRGVDQLQRLHGVSQPVVVGVVDGSISEEFFFFKRTWSLLTHPVPVETSVTAATSVSIAETVVETEERREKHSDLT